ncbi:MAG: cytochrome c [Thiomicrorhabdus sp.]|jgi:cytochrome c556|nr:cytochrome c [Thiomicrorhabdus sp.]
MFIQRKTILIFTTIMFLITPFALAVEQNHHDKADPEHGIHISPDLKKILNQEMSAIQKGMMELIPAIVAGDFEQIASIGKNIKASFIMKQKLTKDQKKELHRALPPSFIEMDQSFHKSAGMLAHAAEQKNSDVVTFYFYKLNDSCVSCHSKFATDRFPGLVKTAEKDGHHD